MIRIQVIIIGVIFLFFFAGVSAGSNKMNNDPVLPGKLARTIPVGGNAYSKLIQEEETGNISDQGIRNWNDEKDVLSIYFRTSKQGSLNLYLKCNVPATSTIKVACSGKSFSVKLKAGENQTVYVGSIAKIDTGYVKVDLQGIKRSGVVFADVSDLIVDGSSVTEAMNYVDNFPFYWGRRGPSVHLVYQFPKEDTFEWFYSEITVPVGFDPIGTYYMANGFGEGYFGMQVNSPTERRVLFSVWSPFSTDDPGEIPESHQIKLIRKGENVHTGEFGNEGSGGQSFMIYPWKTGNTYRFLTRITPDGAGSTQYTSYFYTPDEQKWMLVASFSRPLTDTYYKGAYSFLESFSPETGSMPRKGLYGNQWARTKDGKWVEIRDIRFSADETARKKARMDYKGGVENNLFFLQNCGFLSDYTAIGTLFARPTSTKEPEVDFDELP